MINAIKAFFVSVGVITTTVAIVYVGTYSMATMPSASNQQMTDARANLGDGLRKASSSSIPNCIDVTSTVEELFHELTQKEIDDMPDQALGQKFMIDYMNLIAPFYVNGQCERGKPCPGIPPEPKLGLRANASEREQFAAVRARYTESLRNLKYSSSDARSDGEYGNKRVCTSNLLITGRGVYDQEVSGTFSMKYTVQLLDNGRPWVQLVGSQQVQ
jgi:hypothetical protein